MTRNRLLAIVGAWLLLWVALWLSNADPSAVALAGIVVVIAAAGLVAVDLGRTVQRVTWPLPPESSQPLDNQRVPRTLHGIDAVVRAQPTELRQRLVDLIDDRIRTHHDIDRGTNPELADGLLTPALRRIVADPPRRPPTERELWGILNDIEEL